MTEYYNLPVLFTEEERSRYAQWGMKKSKVMMPMGILLGVIYFGTIIFIVVYYLGKLKHSSDIYESLGLWGCIVLGAAAVIGKIAAFTITKLLDCLLDKLYGRPKEPKMLRLEPSEEGVRYQLFQEKKTLAKGLLTWDAWRTAVYPAANEIWIENQRLRIGANTIETIYPVGHRQKHMDHPAEKIVGTLELGKIQKNLEGYLASLEEREREAQWHREHSL